MTILSSNQILNAISDQLSKSTRTFDLVSAYCKLPVVKHLDSVVQGQGIKKTLIVRMRPLDILKGATDLEVCRYCLDNDWVVYLNTNIHAKLYMFDRERYVLGSANATNSGLGIDCEGNYEMAVTCNADADDQTMIADLINSSTQITEPMYLKMREYIDGLRCKITSDPVLKWPEDLFPKPQQDFSSLSADDFPPNSSPFEDPSTTEKFLKINDVTDMELIKRAFAETKCYQWMVELLTENESHSKRYGDIRKNDLLGKIAGDSSWATVTNCLTHLQDWLKTLNMPEIAIYQPNYTHIFYHRRLTNPDEIERIHEAKKSAKRLRRASHSK